MGMLPRKKPQPVKPPAADFSNAALFGHLPIRDPDRKTWVVAELDDHSSKGAVIPRPLFGTFATGKAAAAEAAYQNHLDSVEDWDVACLADKLAFEVLTDGDSGQAASLRLGEGAKVLREHSRRA